MDYKFRSLNLKKKKHKMGLRYVRFQFLTSLNASLHHINQRQPASYVTVSPQDVSLGAIMLSGLAGVARYLPVHLGLESSPFSSKYKSAHSSHTSPSYPMLHEHFPDPSLVPSPCKMKKKKIKCSF